MDEQSHYKQEKTITRQSISVKHHIFNVIGGTEEFEERDINIGGDFVFGLYRGITPDFDTIALDDLYNNFKIVEQTVKKSAGASNDDKNLAFVTTSGASSTNNINTVNPEVSTATTKVNTASTKICTASFSDATIYAFLYDDLEEIDLKWNMNVSTAIKWDIDGAGFDWSDMAEEEIQANMALMAFSDSEVTNDLLVKLDDTGFKASTYKRGLDESKRNSAVNEYGPRDSSLKSTTDCDKKSENSKKNIDDSLEQHQMTDTQTSSLEEVEPKKVRENNDAPIIEDWVSDDEPNPKVEKKTVIPTATKKEFVKHVKRPVRSFDHIQYSCPNQQRKRIVSGNNYNKKDNDYYSKTSHPSAHKHMAPRAVLMKTGLKSFNTARPVNTVRARGFNVVKPSACWVWRPIKPNGASLSNSQLNDKGFVDSGCSRHMTGNIAHLSDFKDFDGGYVTFCGGAYRGRITGKGTIKTDNLDFDDVYFVKELKFNLFSVSQMCDKKNYVLFTDSECLVLSPNFKLPDENQILLKIPRQDNMYSFDMKNIVPKDSLTCLVAKATFEESMLWHRRLGHINFKNINKLVKENLVRDMPLKRFENDQTCVACLKGKQHRASCKTEAFNPITKALFMLHMDLFGPTFIFNN
ncbi:putative ribonuclease H-like domain-containing protein [Tanacetum coccineum]